MKVTDRQIFLIRACLRGKWACSYGRCKKPAEYRRLETKGDVATQSGLCSKCGKRYADKWGLIPHNHEKNGPRPCC